MPIGVPVACAFDPVALMGLFISIAVVFLSGGYCERLQL